MSKRTYGVTVRRGEPLRLPMHPAAPDQGSWEDWVRESERPVAIDLFSGAGGLSQGLEAAGYLVALSVDVDFWALETHAHNFAGRALEVDLESEDARSEIAKMVDGLRIDLVAGGPPCQPFSRAGRSKIRSLVDLGRRDATDMRKELWRAFLDLVERVEPRAVLMENVPDMALGDDMSVLRHMIDRLENAGYEVDAKIVDAWRYGVPQHRQRLILVGIRDGAQFEWPEPAEGKVTVGKAIGDLPELVVEADAPIGAVTLPYGDLDASDFALKARKNCSGEEADVVRDHLTRAVRPDDLEAFRLMKPGTLYSDLPDHMKRYRDDIFDDKYNRLAWDDCSRSITAHIAKDGYWYIHPEQNRTLTVREAARLQTFPDDFRFAGSRSHQFQQIGNAVPPALAEAVGVALLESVRRVSAPAERRSETRARFRRELAEWATQDRPTAPWAYPEDPWVVAVGLLLGAKGGTEWPSPADILAIAPTLPEADPRLLTALVAMCGTGRRRKSMELVAQAADALRKDPDGWDGRAWMKAVALGPSQRAWFRLLTGRSSALVPSTAVLRVTARVTGTDVDRYNRNSAGRMELAKLVGAGDEAPMLTAAMHRLGSIICTTEEPGCQICPVQQVCAGRRS